MVRYPKRIHQRSNEQIPEDSVLQETHVPRIRYDPDLVLRVTVRIIVSAILGCTVTEGLYFIDRLRPYSSIRDRIIDALTLPGILIARLFPRHAI